jgi:CRISPR-associated protein Cmr5
MSNTIAQERSNFALEKLRSLKCDRQEFSKLASGLPAMVLQNGFGQAMAFLLAKGTNKERKIEKTDKHIQAFDMIKDWLIRMDILTNTESGKFIAELSEIPQAKYLRAQQEALKVMEWIKRYSNAGLFQD